MKKIVCLTVAAVLLFHWFNHPHVLTYNDAAKYAITARSLAQGEGSATTFIYPEYLRFVQDDSQDTWHSYWPPLYPILLSGAFNIFGVGDRSVILISFICFLFLIVLLHLLAKELLGKEYSWIAVLFFVTAPEMLWYSTSGLSEPLFMCFSLGTVLAVLQKNFPMKYLAAGILYALSILTRPIGMIYLPFYAVLLMPVMTQEKNKALPFFQLIGSAAGTFMIVKLCVFLPLGVYQNFHNQALNPFLYNTDIYPASAVMRTMDEISFSKLHVYLPSIFGKIIPNLYTITKNLFAFHSSMNAWNWIHTLAAPFLFFLCFIGFFLPIQDRKVNNFRAALMLLFFIHVFFLAATITVAQLRYFHPLVPYMFILATYALLTLIKHFVSDESKVKRYMGLAAFALIFVFQAPNITRDFYYKKGQATLNPQGYYKTLGGVVDQNSRPGDIVITNLQGWASWYGSRRTVFYPSYPDDLKKLSDSVGADTMIIFEALFEDEISKKHWEPLVYQPQDFGEFKYARTLEVPLNRREFIKAAVYQRRKD